MIADESLRDELARTDPAAGEVAPDVLARVPAEPNPPAPPAQPRPRWRAVLLAAAAVAAVGLLGVAALPVILPSADTVGSDSAPLNTTTGSVAEDAPATQPSQKGADTGTAEAPTMVRTAALLVGTDDPAAAGDRYVQTVTALGGQVTSQTVITEGSPGTDLPVATTAETTSSAPLRWYPSGPGIWLTVQVPADKYEQALAAARATGEVVRLEQSAYDVAAQIADTDARIKALQSSLVRLRALMGEAGDVGEVINLEDAISTRQSELDGLRAQQRELRNQTAMSQISLTLMDPADAKASVDPSPEPGGWTVAGRWAFAILLAMAVIGIGWRVRRRR